VEGLQAITQESIHHNGPMQVRLLAFLIWAGVAASAVFWLLRLWSTSPTAPAHTVAVSSGPPARGDLTRVFGAPAAPAGPAAAPAEPALASRFQLLGVAAPRDSNDNVGLALIAVDGKPARGIKVGAVVDGDLVLQSVHPRGAAVGAAGAAPSLTLELPPVPGAIGAPRPGTPPSLTQGQPGLGVGPGGANMSGSTGAVPPPPLSAPPPGMRAPEAAETAEPPSVGPPGSQQNTR
jgi:general secretion pathway protein C